MKKTILCLLLMLPQLFAVAGTNSDNARKLLDKASAVVTRKGGAQANFSISNQKLGKQTGTIAIKGNKFNARSNNATMWYNGKTLWTYMKSTEEVNVTTPTAAQQQMLNPYTFIRLYKSGYTLSCTKQGANNVVRMVAQNSKSSIKEMYITLSASNTPTQVRMRQGQSDWTTITISNFKTASLSDTVFTFNSKDYPKAEVIDLR